MRKGVLVIALVVLVAACDWPQYLYGPERTGFSPDTSVSAGDITAGRLVRRWSTSGNGTPPVVAHGSVLLGAVGGGIAAFDARGIAGCSGAPVSCSPRWTAIAPGATIDFPAVGGAVLVGNGFDGTNNVVAAFDATGTTGCSGSPMVCSPLWTARTFGPATAVTIANGVVYQAFDVSGADDVQVTAYDLAGARNCAGTPVVCSPLWSARVPGHAVTPPTVGGGVAFLAASTGLFAFDAAGTRNCAFSACSPLWVGAVPGGPPSGAHAVVASGDVFVAGGAPKNLYGFDAAGLRGCSAALGVCQPVWTAAQAGPHPSVANGRIYVSTPNGLAVFDATGTEGCDGTAVKSCSPLWHYGSSGADCDWVEAICSFFSPPVVANGVVYRGFFNRGTNALTEYSAADVNCTGTPKICPAIGSQPGGSNVAPAISNGFVYDPTFDGRVLVAFGLP